MRSTGFVSCLAVAREGEGGRGLLVRWSRSGLSL